MSYSWKEVKETRKLFLRRKISTAGAGRTLRDLGYSWEQLDVTLTRWLMEREAKK